VIDIYEVEDWIEAGKYKRREYSGTDWKDYYAAQQEVKDRFKADAMEAVGLDAHPQADKIFQYAWDEAHAEGLSAVLWGLDKLSELFKDD
jgi:hypothetical protein